ncbi:zinc-finger domain-containing protein [Bacillus thuringiensis]|nr:zinc-finger domain-containing protein [Bacillus thuringiensis]MED2784188.1 zinc-finger domain-containing protein [Bacillus thuringiensis]
MNAREQIIRILNLQDEHCHNCGYGREQSSKYCVENCTLGSEMYQLGTELVSCKGQVRKSKKQKNWNELTLKLIEMLEENTPLYRMAIEIDCEVNWLRKKLREMGIWQPKTQAEWKKEMQKKWDERCKQAAILRETGMTYKAICKQLGCSQNALNQQFKKRGLK